MAQKFLNSRENSHLRLSDRSTIRYNVKKINIITFEVGRYPHNRFKSAGACFMNRFYSASIKIQLFLIALVVAIPSISIVIYAGLQAREEALKEARLATQKFSERIAGEQQCIVVGAEQLMASLAQLPDVQQGNADKVARILANLCRMNAIYSNILVADQDGAVWASAVPTPRSFNVADRRHFVNARRSRRMSSGEFEVSSTTAKPIFSLAYPYSNSHRAIRGVIIVEILIGKYQNLLNKLPMPDHTSFVIMDHRGTILTRALNPELYIGKLYLNDIFRKMQDGAETETTIRKGLEGDMRVITYRKMLLPGEDAPYLYITTGIPLKVALFDANNDMQRNVLLLSIFLVLAFLLAALIAKRSIVNRLRLLENASKDLAAGNFSSRVADQVCGGELGSLGNCLDYLAESVQAQTKLSQFVMGALVKSERNLNDAQQIAHIGSWELNHETSELFGSVESYKIFGVSPEEFGATYEAFMETVHPCDRDNVDFVFSNSLYDKEPYQVVYRIIRQSDGDIRYIHAQCRHQLDEAGRIIRSVGTVQDITEGRRVEEERMRLISVLESTPDLVCIADLDGNILYINRSGKMITGIDDLSNIENVVSRAHPAWAAEMIINEGLPTAIKDGVWEGENILIDRFGQEIPVSQVILCHRNNEGKVLFLSTIVRDIRERKRIEETLLDYQSQLSDLAAELSQAEERERRRIAAQLHDQVAQMLTLCSIKLSSLALLPSEKELFREIDQIKIRLDEIIESTRTLIFQLSPPILYEVGLEAAIVWLCDSIEAEWGMRVKVYDDGTRKPLKIDVSATLFQVTRELVINVAKHAGVGQAIIRLSSENGSIVIQVEDHGAGFDPALAINGTNNRTGFGLFNISQRIRYLGGNLNIRSTPVSGTLVTITVPLEKDVKA